MTQSIEQISSIIKLANQTSRECQTDVSKLNSDSVSLGKFGELDTLEISHEHCRASLSLFGGHLLSYRPSEDGRERLWVSPDSLKDGSKPIRGGIPICWPWFGNDAPKHVSDYATNNTMPAPSHGFARTQKWILDNIEINQEYVQVSLSAAKLGQYGFSLDFEVSLSIKFGKKCSIQLNTHNKSSKATQFGCALHSYFAVKSINCASIVGVNESYKDKTQNFAQFDCPKPYLISTETDRVHKKSDMNAEQSISIVTEEDETRIVNQGNNAVVIWNPWKEQAEKLVDMEQSQYEKMLCVESAVVEPITLNPMQTHCLSQTIC